ncbi:hypothetical protein [uncultured Winogradskyella sp.]|uniref:hypothetical protein n=1 Tax=uncultured Winogradskyella sp. TaxID=395353 RepID=UPI00262E54D4|nr:hypothetical protein [uncultured Winogradskyella sp.]
MGPHQKYYMNPSNKYYLKKLLQLKESKHLFLKDDYINEIEKIKKDLITEMIFFSYEKDNINLKDFFEL